MLTESRPAGGRRRRVRRRRERHGGGLRHPLIQRGNCCRLFRQVDQTGCARNGHSGLSGMQQYGLTPQRPAYPVRPPVRCPPLPRLPA
jgi:hypothetical protein